MRRLAGKTALITGASSGIGRAIAKRFHDEGATLLLMDVTEQVVEGGEPTHKILNVPFFRGDVSREADVEEAVRRAAEPTGRLDTVVNDAVIRVGKKLTDTSLDEWNRVMAVNVTGVFLMCRAAVRKMLGQEIRHEARGRIVNISSQHGMIASPEDCSYGVSKSAVVYLTRQIAADYGRDSIICNAVAAKSSPARVAAPSSRAGSTTATPARPCLGSAARRTSPMRRSSSPRTRRASSRVKT
jgi:NAD(P)-dependent dehydrogenase (short-subunit alcohol dehydrogenase family)